MSSKTAKVAVVTGANKGIGFAIVRGLCKRFNGTVYLTSRDVDRGHKAVEDLKKQGLNVNYHQLDITNKESIQAFYHYIIDNYLGIDILLNNAAMSFKKNSTEPVSIQAEQTLHVNYFSLVSVCDILFPLLKNGARVINVSSSLGHLSYIPSKVIQNRLMDPNLTVAGLSELMQSYVDAAKQDRHAAEWGTSSYGISKAGVVALTKIQQRLLDDRDIKVNAVHPGYVSTDMSSNKGLLTIDQGAEAPLYLALDAPDSIRGQYVWYDKKVVNWDGNKPQEVFGYIKQFLGNKLGF